MKKIILSLIILLNIIAIPGCTEFAVFSGLVSVAVNAFIAWKEGEAHGYFAADAETAHAAVQQVVQDLGYSIKTDELNKNKDYYLLATSHDQFKIKIEKVEPYITRISIRVNIMGDKPYVELIYAKLAKQLDAIDYKKALIIIKRQRLHHRI